jgi:hypothetical protein
MNVYGGVNPYESFRFGFGYFDTIQRQSVTATARQQRPVTVDRDQSFFTQQQVMRMREAVQAIKPEMLEPQEVQVASPASATSAAGLDLDTTATSATLKSTEEVNTTATSFSTRGPEYTGSSSAQATISGAYDGSNGSGTLTFQVTAGGTHGTDKLQLTVKDANDNAVDLININKKDAIDKQYSLSNGLVFSLGAGELVTNDTFTLSVDDAAPPSYSPSEPDWQGSTASATIGGIYNGANGTDTLTFSVSLGGTHGTDNLQISVFDSGNNQIDQIDISSLDSIDQQYTLSNGLTLSLAEGNLLEGSSFTVAVFDSVGAAVAPDNPFNGTRLADPNLEDGLSVTAGTFEINGTTIDVQAGDSLNTVLARINQSDAGVTATFDAATEKVLLTQKTAGAGQDIVLANDTTGFLVATKLDGVVATPGKDSETEKALAEVDAFSTVQSGSISVNGVSIDIDVNTDTLNDILDRISASGAGVEASFDGNSRQVSLSAESATSQMELSSGSTSFFAAIGISEGSYNAADDLIQASGVRVIDVADRIVDSIVEENAEKPWEQAPAVDAAPVSTADNQMLTTMVSNMAHAMNALFDDSAAEGSPVSFLERVRNDIRSAVASWSGSQESQFKTDFGINFDFEKTKEGVFKFSRAERQQFKSALATPEGAASVRNALFGQDSNGLINHLHASLTSSAADLESQSAYTGLYLDISV